MADVTVPLDGTGVANTRAVVAITTNNTTAQWPTDLRTKDALSARQILLSSDNWQSWKAAEDTLENRQLMRDTVEKDGSLYIHTIARRLRKLSLDNDDKTDYNVDNGTKEQRIHYLLCFLIFCIFPQEYEVYVPLSDLDPAQITASKHTFNLETAFKESCIKRHRNLMRDMLRETISDGETPHINGVGDVSMPTASLDEHYVDRLVLVAECMKEMAQKLNELMRQLDVFTDQIGDRSLNDIRSLVRIDSAYVIWPMRGRNAAKFARQVAGPGYVSNCIQALIDQLVLGEEDRQPFFKGLGRLVCVQDFALSDAGGHLPGGKLTLSELVVATNPYVQEAAQQAVNEGPGADPAPDLLAEVLGTRTDNLPETYLMSDALSFYTDRRFQQTAQPRPGIAKTRPSKGSEAARPNKRIKLEKTPDLSLAQADEQVDGEVSVEKDALKARMQALSFKLDNHHRFPAATERFFEYQLDMHNLNLLLWEQERRLSVPGQQSFVWKQKDARFKLVRTWCIDNACPWTPSFEDDLPTFMQYHRRERYLAKTKAAKALGHAAGTGGGFMG